MNWETITTYPNAEPESKGFDLMPNSGFSSHYTSSHFHRQTRRQNHRGQLFSLLWKGVSQIRGEQFAAGISTVAPERFARLKVYRMGVRAGNSALQYGRFASFSAAFRRRSGFEFSIPTRPHFFETTREKGIGDRFCGQNLSKSAGRNAQ